MSGILSLKATPTQSVSHSAQCPIQCIITLAPFISTNSTELLWASKSQFKLCRISNTCFSRSFMSHFIGLPDKLITYTINCLDICRGPLVVLNFVADILYMRINGPVIPFKIISEYYIDKLKPGKYLPWTSCNALKDLEFCRCKDYG